MPRVIFSDMSDLGASPQFSTAEYAPKSGDICRSCNQAIGGQYYRLNGAMTCPACADSVRRGAPRDTPGAFSKAVIAGAAAAVVGLMLYAAVGIITGWIIGYVSLAVGYIVGHAMMKASGGIGGRRYQMAALIFTYAAVSMAAIPVYIAQAMKHEKQVAAHTSRPAASAQAPAGNTARPATTSDPSTSTPPVAEGQAQSSSAPAAQSSPNPAPRQRPSRLMLVGQLLFFGLASPFLELADPVHGVIGLVILLVGLRMAWSITADTRKVVLDGPFDNTVAART
jgi:hypothetical protein